MNFEHVSAFIEQRLLLGVALRLLRGEAEIGERGLGLAAGRSVGQIAFGLLLGRWRENEVQGLRSAGGEGEVGGLRFEALGEGGDFVVGRRKSGESELTGGVGLRAGGLAVFKFLTLILALSRAPPEASVTVPVIPAFVCCAIAFAADRSSRIATNHAGLASLQGIEPSPYAVPHQCNAPVVATKDATTPGRDVGTKNRTRIAAGRGGDGVPRSWAEDRKRVLPTKRGAENW